MNAPFAVEIALVFLLAHGFWFVPAVWKSQRPVGPSQSYGAVGGERRVEGRASRGSFPGNLPEGLQRKTA